VRAVGVILYLDLKGGRPMFAEMAESPFRECVWDIKLKAEVTVKNAVTESGKKL